MSEISRDQVAFLYKECGLNVYHYPHMWVDPTASKKGECIKYLGIYDKYVGEYRVFITSVNFNASLREQMKSLDELQRLQSLKTRGFYNDVSYRFDYFIRSVIVGSSHKDYNALYGDIIRSVAFFSNYIISYGFGNLEPIFDSIRFTTIKLLEWFIKNSQDESPKFRKVLKKLDSVLEEIHREIRKLPEQ